MEKSIYDDSKVFGEFIQKLRQYYGWTRLHVAKQIGLSSESSVMNFEIGNTVMRPKYVHRFCQMTPNKITLPVLYAMFEAGSLHPPCKCVCHHDMNNVVPNIYEKDGRCRLCGHTTGDCEIINGLWFSREGFIRFL